MPDSPHRIDNHKQNLSRRKVLKALTAVGGAVAATNLMPGKWTSPIIDLGVLPAHAQTNSAPIELVGNLQITPGGGGSSLSISEVSASGAGALIYTAECQYRDPLMSMTTANTTATGRTQCTPNVPTSVLYVSPENAASGVVGFSFSTPLCNLSTTEFCTSVSSGGRSSNEVCGTLPEPS